MALYLRGKTWWVYLVAPNGRKIRRSTNTSSKREAEQVHAILHSKLIQSPKQVTKKDRTLAHAIERWLEEATHKATYDRDLRVLTQLAETTGHIKLNELTADHIRQALSDKTKTSKRSTINCYLAIIRAVLRKAERQWEWVEKAPCITLLPTVERRIRYLTVPEAKILLEELPPHQREIAMFAMLTGLRKSNVLGLSWEQVDLKRGVAWIHADQSKNRKPIAVPLGNEAIQLLIHKKETSSAGIKSVFTYRDKRITQVNTKAFRKALRRAGIENFRWHDLRHTWASWHIQNGTPIHVLQELGGWHSFEMVKRYAHLSPQHLKVYSNQIGFEHDKFRQPEDRKQDQVHEAG